MSESRVFQLERFYYGLLVDRGQRSLEKPNIIAHTPNITPIHAAECVQTARLVPPLPEETTDDMPGALGLFRGQTTDFVLAKAQHNDAGLPQILYILVPVAVLRWLGGNVMTFRSLAKMEMPAFSTIKPDLMPYELHDPNPPDAEQQTDSLFDLVEYCHNSLETMEGILAALVQGWPIAIVNSPASVEQRLRFIQGLLSLLPVPARVGITFATHLHTLGDTQVQIKFMSRVAHPEHHMIYDWTRGSLLTRPPEDVYSRYILRQFRLDPHLVVEQTEQLSRTAVWRARHRENLGRALAWVSRRAALDQTVLQGQPADRRTVAAILAEDPTLPDHLRQVYVRHLLAFTLALEDITTADIIPTVASENPDIVDTVTNQLRTAIDNQQTYAVYAMLTRWFHQAHQTFARPWFVLLRQAAIHHLASLFESGRIDEATTFLAELQRAPADMGFNDSLPDIVQAALPAARTNPDVARTLFLLSVEALPAGDLYRLLSDEEYARQLPKVTQTTLEYLKPEPKSSAPPNVLVQGARVFGDGYRMVVLARFVEWAIYSQRPELIDTTALQSLLVMVQSAEAKRYLPLIDHVIEDFGDVSTLRNLEPPGHRVLVQLLLQIGEYDQAVYQLEFYQNEVIGLDRLDVFTELAGEVFLLTPLETGQINEALGYLEGSQIRPEPRAMIYAGALENREWADDLDYAASRLTTMLFNDSMLIDIIGHDNTLKLLAFHARHENAIDALRVGSALVDNTLHMGKEGAVLLGQMWPLIIWDFEIKVTSLELLRRYIRGVPIEEAPMLITFFEEEVGTEIAGSLRATYVMRLAMESSGLMRFADDIHTAARLLVDIATIYHGNKELPPKHRLRRDLDTMSGGISDDERQQVADNILNITQQVLELGQNRTRKSGRKHIEPFFVKNQVAPRTGVDLLRFVGGYLAQQQIIPLDLEVEAMAHIFGNRSAVMFLRETGAITRLFHGLQRAFTDKAMSEITVEALTGELDSLWSTLSLYNQRQLQEQFAQDCQHLAEAIGIMADHSNERVLSEGGTGRQLETGRRQPQTALETLRWIHGYFARSHIRTRS
ncbi:MAG: hypothetical protein JW966_14190 [Anaerolineae bacterium]|nr:hypothetical protein [Anaerolineae bacterium]